MILLRKEISLLSVLLLFSAATPAETLNLSPDFVNRNMNRATISIQFELDAHLKTPHTISSSGDDGDVHMAGRAPEVQLPMVAEIMNAGLDGQSASLTLMNQASPGQTIPITGAWRIWFEHPASGDQTQGDPVDAPIGNTNPDHVFEIHPITQFGPNDIANSSFVPIDQAGSSTPPTSEDYTAYPAAKAFASYEGLQSTISVSDSAVSITAKKAGYNYAEFLIQPVDQPMGGDDGTFVRANVYDVSDSESTVTAAPRRMVFVTGTAPELALRQLPQGQMLHVLGIPRVNLAEVSAISGSNVDMPLPYEMIIVAIFADGFTPGAAKAREIKPAGRKTTAAHKPAKPAR